MMLNETVFPDLPDSGILRQSKLLLIYISPFLLFIGTLTAILSISVLLRKPMRKSTTMFYLAVLSFVDISVLNTGLLRHWLISTFNINVRTFSDFSCKFHTFMTYFTLDYSAWILVAVTFDRCLSVCFPLKSRHYCTLGRCRLSAFIIAILLFLVNGHLFFTVELRDGKCQERGPFVSSTWPLIDFAVFCFLPFILMIICNIFIIRVLIQSYKTFQEDRSLTLERKQNQQKQKMSVTTMLLSVNATFFFCTFPISLFFICERFYREKYPDLMDLFGSISNLLMYLNNAVHFFMYCLTGTKFRKQLSLMCSATFTRKTSSPEIKTSNTCINSIKCSHST